MMNGGYDYIIESNWSNNMLILSVENEDNINKTKGEIGITFIDKDTVLFTLVSGTAEKRRQYQYKGNYYFAKIYESAGRRNWLLRYNRWHNRPVGKGSKQYRVFWLVFQRLLGGNKNFKLHSL